MNGKRKQISMLITIVGLALSMLCLCGCQSSSNSSAAESSNENLPELRIGVDLLKPYFYLDRNGEYQGIDAEIAKEACSRAGYKPVFVNLPWSERDAYLADGSIDCVWTAFVMDGREQDYLWTNPYLYSKEALIVDSRCPSDSLSSFNGPGGIAVRANSKAEELMAGKLPDAIRTTNIHTYGTFDMATTAFVKAYTDGLAGHRIVLQEIMNEYPDRYRYLDENLATLSLGVAFAPTNSECRNNIDAALASMKEDGTLSGIVSKYDQGHTCVEAANDAS